MDIIKPTRRGFLGLLGGLLAAPAIVRAGSLMPVKVLPPADAYEMVSVMVGPHRPFGETVVIDYLLPGLDGPTRHQIKGVVPFKDMANGAMVDIGKVPEGARIIGSRLLIGGSLGDCQPIIRSAYADGQRPMDAVAVRDGGGIYTIAKHKP